VITFYIVARLQKTYGKYDFDWFALFKVKSHKTTYSILNDACTIGTGF
jgi:hypothetical protein